MAVDGGGDDPSMGCWVPRPPQRPPVADFSSSCKILWNPCFLSHRVKMQHMAALNNSTVLSGERCSERR